MSANRDRFGELLEQDSAEVDPGTHRCNAGWLSHPDEDVARPCLACRPHLRRPGRTTP